MNIYCASFCLVAEKCTFTWWGLGGGVGDCKNETNSAPAGASWSLAKYVGQKKFLFKKFWSNKFEQEKSWSKKFREKIEAKKVG